MDRGWYRDDGLERPVQLVDVGEDMLEALFLFCLLASPCVFLSIVRWGNGKHYHGDLAEELFTLLLKVGLFPRPGLGLGAGEGALM